MDYDPTHPFLQRNDEAFKKFFNVESEFVAAQGYSHNAEKAITRSIVVTLIEMLSKGSDYDAFVPYLAVNYLDRMLSRKSHLPALERNPCKNTKLFAICCFTLASKMRNGDFSVPNFLAKRKLTTSVNPLLLLEMERRILTTLEWRMQSLTAINFLEYFCPFFKLRHPQPIRGFTRRDIAQSILSVQGDIKFTQFKPSIIAASAVLSASFEAFPAQFLQRAEAFLRCQYIDKDALLLCMEAMGIEVQQDLEGLKEAVKLDEAKKIEEDEASKIREAKRMEEIKELWEQGKKFAEDMKIVEAKKKEETKKKEEAKKEKKAEDKNMGKKVEYAKKIVEDRKADKVKGVKEDTGTAKRFIEDLLIKEAHIMVKAAKIEEERKIEEAKKEEEAKKIEEARKREDAKKIEEAIKKRDEARKIEEAKLKRAGVTILSQRRKMEEAKKSEEEASVGGRKMEEVKKSEEAVKKSDEARKIEEAIVEGIKFEEGQKMEEAQKNKEVKDIKDKRKKVLRGIKIEEGKKTEEMKKVEEAKDFKNKGKGKVDEGPDSEELELRKSRKAAKWHRKQNKGRSKVPGLHTIEEWQRLEVEDDKSSEEEEFVMNFELKWPVAELEGDMNFPEPIPLPIPIPIPEGSRDRRGRQAITRQPTSATAAAARQPMAATAVAPQPKCWCSCTWCWSTQVLLRSVERKRDTSMGSVPDQMGKYKIFGTIELREISCIYKAIDSQANQRVILKRETFLKGNEGVPCSAIREISFLKEMDHTNIIKLLDVVNEDRSVYLVMEYMDLNLRKYMMDTSLDIMKKPRIIKNLLHQILEGLAYCHSNKILHRGLKPESLLLDHGNQSIVKIADFGTARSICVPARRHTEERKVTSQWYRAPELLLGAQKYTKAVDMWAVGCILAEMAIQQPLVAATTEIEQLNKIFSILGKPCEATWPGVTALFPTLASFVDCIPKDLNKVLPDLEPDGVDLVYRMLRLNPEDRITASDALNHQYF